MPFCVLGEFRGCPQPEQLDAALWWLPSGALAMPLTRLLPEQIWFAPPVGQLEPTKTTPQQNSQRLLDGFVTFNVFRPMNTVFQPLKPHLHPPRPAIHPQTHQTIQLPTTPNPLCQKNQICMHPFSTSISHNGEHHSNPNMLQTFVGCKWMSKN